jgi:hypothetical protein
MVVEAHAGGPSNVTRHARLDRCSGRIDPPRMPQQGEPQDRTAHVMRSPPGDQTRAILSGTPIRLGGAWQYAVHIFLCWLFGLCFVLATFVGKGTRNI